MNFRRLSLALVACAGVSGCGTYIPSIRDSPTDDTAEIEMIQEVARTINCELNYTITKLVLIDKADSEAGGHGKTYVTFLKDWGVQVAMNLTIYERTNANPTLLLTPPSIPSSIFTLAGGVSVGAESYRLQKINFFYTVAELYHPEIFHDDIGLEACRNPSGYNAGSPLIDSDLRLFPMLKGRIGATALGFTRAANLGTLASGEKNAVSQTVSFKVTVAGQVTPSWKLVRASVNPSGTFFSAGRDRTHELVFTFGPLDKTTPGSRALTQLAQQLHLDTQLQSGIRNSLVTP